MLLNTVLPEEINIRRSSGEMITGSWSEGFVVVQEGVPWVHVTWYAGGEQFGKIVSFHEEYMQLQKLEDPRWFQYL